MPRPKQFNEDEVLEKAMELFWKQGCHATSIQNLVDYLGINRASLYDTFGGKEELYRRALEKYRTLNRQRIIEFLQAHASVREGFQKLFEFNVEDILNDADQKGCFVVNSTAELANQDRFVANFSLQNRHDFESIFLQYLQKGVDQREISPEKDLKAIASLLFLLQNGMRLVGKTNPSRKELMATVHMALSVLD